MLKKYPGLKQRWSKTTLRKSPNANICYVCGKRFSKHEQFNKCEFYIEKSKKFVKIKSKNVSFWCQSCTPIMERVFLNKQKIT